MVIKFTKSRKLPRHCFYIVRGTLSTLLARVGRARVSTHPHCWLALAGLASAPPHLTAALYCIHTGTTQSNCTSLPRGADTSGSAGRLFVIHRIRIRRYYYNDYNAKCTANCTSVPAAQYALFYLSAPFYVMGQKIDFAVRLATMPGRHSGDQVHKVKKTPAPSFDGLLRAMTT